MFKLTEEPMEAKIAKVEFLQEKLFGVSVTFHIRNADVIEEQFLLYKPWRAWGFAQLMKLCNEATNIHELVGQNVQLILGNDSEGTSVAAICDVKSNTIYPFNPYGSFFMKGYTQKQFWHDWYA